MTADLAKSNHINAPSRCTQRFSNGKRCRLFAKPDSTLCPRHAVTAAEDLAAALTAGLDEFTSATPVNQFLSRLLLLLAQDRISPRRGAVMAYTANLLLRTVSVMDAEKELNEEPTTIVYEIGVPRPDYSTDIKAQQPASLEPTTSPSAVAHP